MFRQFQGPSTLSQVSSYHFLFRPSCPAASLPSWAGLVSASASQSSACWSSEKPTPGALGHLIQLAVLGSQDPLQVFLRIFCLSLADWHRVMELC